jgi:hypothetical protein
MNIRSLCAALLVSALSMAACGEGSAPAAAPQMEASHQADLTRAALVDATAAAKAYGQAHLGHYLDLRPRDLAKEGLELPESISLAIRTKHTAFCLTATNTALPSIHPWSQATSSSRTQKPSSVDRCLL